jgi:hypothetical protein
MRVSEQFASSELTINIMLGSGQFVDCSLAKTVTVDKEERD